MPVRGFAAATVVGLLLSGCSLAQSRGGGESPSPVAPTTAEADPNMLTADQRDRLDGSARGLILRAIDNYKTRQTTGRCATAGRAATQATCTATETPIGIGYQETSIYDGGTTTTRDTTEVSIIYQSGANGQVVRLEASSASRGHVTIPNHSENRSNSSHECVVEVTASEAVPKGTPDAQWLTGLVKNAGARLSLVDCYQLYGENGTGDGFAGTIDQEGVIHTDERTIAQQPIGAGEFATKTQAWLVDANSFV